jgi:uncharacterized glyoxalase superfamily metalloenzyme YdcJ
LPKIGKFAGISGKVCDQGTATDKLFSNYSSSYQIMYAKKVAAYDTSLDLSNFSFIQWAKIIFGVKPMMC